MLAYTPVAWQVGHNNGLWNVGHDVHQQYCLVLILNSGTLHGIGNLYRLVVQEDLQLVVDTRFDGNGLLGIEVVGGCHVDIIGTLLQLVVLIVRTEQTVVSRGSRDGCFTCQGIGNLHGSSTDMRAVAVVGTQGVGIHNVHQQAANVGTYHRALHLHVEFVTVLWFQTYNGLVGAIDNQVFITGEVQCHRGLSVLVHRSHLCSGQRQPRLSGRTLHTDAARFLQANILDGQCHLTLS